MVNQKTSEVTPLGKCFPNPLGNENDSQTEQIRAKVLLPSSEQQNLCHGGHNWVFAHYPKDVIWPGLV